jgi:internalin A
MAQPQSQKPGESPEEVAEERIQQALGYQVPSSLNLNGLGLTALPESLGQLTNLRRLYAHTNQLTTLPEWLCQLISLEELSLAFNRLTALPESIGRQARLEELSLASNQLTALPESMGQLARLRRLDLHDNGLTILPESLRKLRSLRELYLHGNGALGLPAEVLGPSANDVVFYDVPPAKPSGILDYYFRAQKGSRPLNEAKLILVGRGNVGKTCIVNRLVHDCFDPNEKKTEGIRITQWKVTLDVKEDVRLNIWDFGGQEIMHSTHLFFLTQRSLYLLVLNGRGGGEDADAEYWLQLIESFGGGSPVIVVLNKIREQPFDLNRRALQQKYPGVRAFVRTDCSDRTGLAELGAAIERESDRLEGLRDRFPASWFAVKDRLAGMRENYLSFERYRQLCEELGERESDAQEHLAANLHKLGIALNYKDDPRLRDTHVLNPHWITSGIYKVLNAERLEQQKGVLRLADLAGVLDTADYPPSKHLFLLDLMKKFELCFEFPDDVEHRYLVPELLDKQEPDLRGDFEAQQCLNFDYFYNIVPEGLVPRFIVRTHILSPPDLRWRAGVVLEFEGNRALVKADARDRKVTISIMGPVAGRRRLLAVIRSDFEAIHRDIKKLQVAEMVPVRGHPEVAIPYTELNVMEQSGLAKLPKVIGNVLVELDVREMLNGVDLDGTRRRADISEHGGTVRVFVAYSHKDETLRAELDTHLKLLQRQGLISVWTDHKITAGEEWKGMIDENLESAGIILLLVSADFVASDYSYDVEMKRALERHEARTSRVIPIILRDVDWQSAPFGKLQALPRDGRPVTMWENKDSGWKDVAVGIRKVAEQIRF